MNLFAYLAIAAAALCSYVAASASSASTSASTATRRWTSSSLFRAKMGQVLTIAADEDDEGGGDSSSSSSSSDSRSSRSYSMECLSERPRVFRVRNLLTQEESNEIVQDALPFLEKSMIANVNYDNDLANDAGDAAAATDADATLHVPFVEQEQLSYRLSDHTWLDYADRATAALQRRVAKLTCLSNSYVKDHSELLQVLRYECKGQFKPHHDSSIGNKRLVTFLVYLNNVDTQFQGGTWFPFGPGARDRSDEVVHMSIEEAVNEALRINVAREEAEEEEEEGVEKIEKRSINSNSNKMDTIGLVQSPEQGTGLLFFNHLEDGSLDSCAVHAGLPLLVEKGSDVCKWACNVWIGGNADEDA